jgi:hypothetical protein
MSSDDRDPIRRELEELRHESEELSREMEELRHETEELGDSTDEQLRPRREELVRRANDVRTRSKEVRRRLMENRAALIRRSHSRHRKTAIALLPVAIFPWLTLGGKAPSYGVMYIAMIAWGILWPIWWVWTLLRNRSVLAAPAMVVVCLVIEQAMFVEGTFAQIYHAMSAHSPHSFDPSPMSGIDAAYFTISTATTTGMGDIHPVSGNARLLVTAQMIASLYLIVIAITTAVQRVLAPAARHADDARL